MPELGWKKHHRFLKNLFPCLGFANLILLVGLLAACSQAAAPTLSAHPSEKSPTASASPTVTSTPTESATPTPEVKNYGICEAESFMECPIPPEDLFNGEYLAFLETLSTPFDPNTMKQVPWFNDGSKLRPDDSSIPNFEGMTTIGAESGADFRRGVASGFVEFESLPYLILPVEFYDQEHPDKNVWVIGVYPLFYFYSNGDMYLSDAGHYVKVWRDLMKVTPLYVKSQSPGGALRSALTYQTFDEDPTMEQRFADFTAGKRSSLHGKVLMIWIISDDGKPIDFLN